MELNFFRPFGILLCFLPALALAQQQSVFYISNKGNDAYPGTTTVFAKKTIAATAPLLKVFSTVKGTVNLALKSGDIFNENLVTSYPIHLESYTDKENQNDFAVLNGSKEFNTGWSLEQGTAKTFRQDVPYNGFVGYGINGIGSYSFIYVFEVDRALEKTAPFSARKLLKFVSRSAIENTPGSFYVPDNKENPKPVFIHTSDGSSPNNNPKYRYEVTVRDWAINSTYQEGNHFENLWVRGFGAGNGMLPGGANSYYNKVVFGPGAGIHHLVVRSGTINNSLFLPAAKNTSNFAVVFYDVEGLGRHCTIKNSMFLDVPTPLYAHTSGSKNYGAVEMSNVVAIADTSDAGSFMYTSNTDTVILNNVYADGYYSGYHYGNARFVTISNSYFKDVNFGIAYNNAYNPIVSTINNVFIKTKGSTQGMGIIIQGATTLNLENSIVHIADHRNNPNTNNSSLISGAGGTANKITASGNIFICDVDPAKSLYAANTNTNNGIATSADSWNNNVYVLLKGKKLLWTVTDPSTNGGKWQVEDFEEWKKQSGQDQNSLFFDLRNDHRGLKAIFSDPDNGDYSLVDTKEGREIAALRAGMTDPLTCFLKKPSYEEAADLIRNNKVLSVNSCKNPCNQNTIRINHTFSLAQSSNRQVELQWHVAEQDNVDHYEIHRSTESSIFERISFLAVTGDSMYSFINNIEPGVSYRYRLAIVPKAGGKCFSDSRPIKITDNREIIVYPNPSTGKVLISMNNYFGDANIIVTNSLGQVVLSNETLSLYRAHELDLTNQPKGIYFLKVITSKGSSVQTFSLQ